MTYYLEVSRPIDVYKKAARRASTDVGLKLSPHFSNAGNYQQSIRNYLASYLLRNDIDGNVVRPSIHSKI